MDQQAPDDALPGRGAPRESQVVVGIAAAASAGDALARFLARIPPDSGLAFVIVEPPGRERPQLLGELLIRHARLPVQPVQDGQRIESNAMYVAPPGAETRMERGILRALPALDEASARLPVDRFFRSLAEDRGPNAVGIVLSSTGNDGLAGLRAVKQQGGLTLALSPQISKYDSMPRSAIEAGLVDHTLGADEIATQLLNHVRYFKSAAQHEAEKLDALLRAHLGTITALLHAQTGHDFSGYKEGTLLRRIQRRMLVLRTADVNEYQTLLERDPREADALFRDLLIGVSDFFRDAEAFECLEQEIVPQLFAAAPPDAPLRIWVPGCASGEEPYSLAILAAEWRMKSGDERRVQIFATDIDEDLLAQARSGRYSAENVGRVSPQRLAQFFTRDDDGYRVCKELREMCIFSGHNLIKDPPFSALDLISCRNVLIYLELALQARLVPLFHYALRPGGYLFLGPAEGLAGYPELFAAVHKRQRIFQRKEDVSRPPIDMPFVGRGATRLPSRVRPDTRSPILGAASIGQVLDRLILEEYAPSCAVINEQGDLLHIAGRIGRYLQLLPGNVSTNVLDMATGPLRLELRTALYRATQTRRQVVRDNVVVELDGQSQRVRLTVRPMPDTDPGSGLYVLVVQDAGAPDPLDAEKVEAPPPADEPVVLHLETELRIAREDLQTAVEEVESANEELRASNEELTSTNEELQSANEELQTSQEELQLLNEELETVNTDLQRKVDELDAAHSDLQNLFASTQIATIFLDRDLCIKKFTPAATAMFHLLDADIGRPIHHLAPRFMGHDLVTDVREVLADLTMFERQVAGDDGCSWFMLRILPYRTTANVIAGVVVTFVDVTPLKRAELALQHLAEQRRLALEAAELGTFDYDYAGGEVHWDERSHELFGISPAGSVSYDAVLAQIHPDDRSATHEALQRAIDGVDGGMYHREFRVVWPDGSVHWLAGHGRAYFEGEGDCRRAVRFVGVNGDITQRKAAEEALRAATAEARQRAAELNAIFDALPDAVLFFNPEGRPHEISAATVTLMGEDITGYDDEKLAVVLERLDAHTAEGRPLTVDQLPARRVLQGEVVRGQIVERTGAGGQREVYEINAAPVATGGAVGVWRNVTLRKRAEQSLRESEARFRTLFTSMSEGFALHEIVCDQLGTPCDYRFLDVNPSFERLTGLQREQVVGRLMSEVLPNDDPHWIKVYGEVALNGQSVHFQHYSPALQRHYDVYAYSPALRYFAVLFMDISERKRAEQQRHDLELQILHAQKLESLGVMAGGVAHDFNNILAGILGQAELALRGLSDACGPRECVTCIKEAAQRAGELTRQMLAYTGKGRLHIKPVVLSRVVEELMPMLKVSVSKKATIECRLAAELPAIEADVAQLRQVVMNLVINASEALRDENGSISITTRSMACTRSHLAAANVGSDVPEGEYVVLEVVDTGCGIDAQNVTKIFDPFFSTKFAGRGLGLAAVQGIVRGHHGAIQVVSYPERGSLFRVFLPVGPVPLPVSAPLSAPAPANTWQGQGTVLIVDDEDLVRRSTEALIGSAGFSVLTAADGQQAIDVFRAHQGHIVGVILDLTMPKMSGEEVLRELRRLDPNVRVILTSGHSEEEMRQRFAGQQVLGFVEKPASIDVLLALLQESLGRRE